MTILLRFYYRQVMKTEELTWQKILKKVKYLQFVILGDLLDNLQYIQKWGSYIAINTLKINFNKRNKYGNMNAKFKKIQNNCNLIFTMGEKHVKNK